MSPEVAATIMALPSRRSSSWSKSLATTCRAMSLKAKVGPVEQLEQPVVVVQRHQRTHVGMAEAGIGVSDQCLELVSVDGAAHVRGHQAGGQVGITELARLTGCAGSQLGHLLGDI